jgi:SAM-dependent methyltransferase
MNDTFKGQVTRTAADIYEEFFVPALFQQWTGPVAEAAVVSPGQKALDVACGTGVLTRELARRVGPGGTTVGVDRNEGMLAVAARRSPNIHWMPGLAEELPFEDDSFDAVVSQFGLMFFDDRAAAVDEMWRVLRPGGKIAVAVWDAVERSPGYAQMIDLLDELFGERIANELRGPFVLGNPSELAKVFADAKIPDSTIETLPGTARFSSLDDRRQRLDSGRAHRRHAVRDASGGRACETRQVRRRGRCRRICGARPYRLGGESLIRNRSERRVESPSIVDPVPRNCMSASVCPIRAVS